MAVPLPPASRPRHGTACDPAGSGDSPPAHGRSVVAHDRRRPQRDHAGTRRERLANRKPHGIMEVNRVPGIDLRPPALGDEPVGADAGVFHVQGIGLEAHAAGGLTFAPRPPSVATSAEPASGHGAGAPVKAGSRRRT
jgi:hypothetical protein